ncbi:hypothetical protein RS694_18225 [Rhodoferax saidenbachensis]|uniref:Uncharacterized protein n=2 Tax=Rhodoferax saidenbachensis TaxID=1484693 RepID=A0A1P8KE28_9BURK|nr:hypothetical protein RS694_18225 [Rhodoferax saidenbachensis]
MHSANPVRYVAFIFWVLSLLAGCGPKTIAWTEDVQLQSGEIIQTRRTALAEPFGQIGGTGGWENEGMTVEIMAPAHPENPGPWSAKFVPLVFDRDPETKEWFMVATFYSCTSWYNLGRPKLPYTEFRYRNSQWVQQALSEKLIGREANMLTSIRSSGEPNHTISSKQLIKRNPKIEPEYKGIVAKWRTAC